MLQGNVRSLPTEQWIGASIIPWLTNNLAHGRANDDSSTLALGADQKPIKQEACTCISIHCDVLAVDGVGDSTTIMAAGRACATAARDHSTVTGGNLPLVPVRHLVQNGRC
jgi:hypothetical protein